MQVRFFPDSRGFSFQAEDAEDSEALAAIFGSEGIAFEAMVMHGSDFETVFIKVTDYPKEETV